MITLKNNKKELFDTIAEKYDRINNAISLFTHTRFKKDAINKIPNEHYSILDLCCGTGDICELLKKKYPNSSIIGLDFSQKMLNIAIAAVAIFAIGYVFYKNVILSAILCLLALKWPKIRVKQIIAKIKIEWP